MDEIAAKLQGMTVFTIVDFKTGYWMVLLHPDSRKLTCMALPFGRFQWTRLPMGTVVAQDSFQTKLDAIFIAMEGVRGIADDMIIAGKDEMEHDRNDLQCHLLVFKITNHLPCKVWIPPKSAIFVLFRCGNVDIF